MKRIEEKIASEICLDLTYTPEQLDYISKITHGVIFGRQVSIGNVKRFSTIEGIEKQLDSFSSRIGLIYWLKFSGSVPDMTKMAVEIPYDLFYTPEKIAEFA